MKLNVNGRRVDIAACGACTVHINRQQVRSCSIFVEDIEDGAEVTTIEGLDSPATQAVQTA